MKKLHRLLTGKNHKSELSDKMCKLRCSLLEELSKLGVGVEHKAKKKVLRISL